MTRTSSLVACVLLGALAIGCTPESEKRDLEFELRRVERERDAMDQRLDAEKARYTALQKRMEAKEASWRTANAQVSAMRDQVRKLTDHIEELEAWQRKLREREIERPEVALSPLPESVDASLLTFAEQYGDRVWYDRGRGAISLANDRLFAMGSDDVREDAMVGLNDLAAILALDALADHEVIIVGHTDAAPITKPETLAVHPSNWHLSVHRAIAVKDVLTKAGVPARRIGVMGYGQYRPISETDHARNRRVEIFIVPEGGVQAFAPVRP